MRGEREGAVPSHHLHLDMSGLPDATIALKSVMMCDVKV